MEKDNHLDPQQQFCPQPSGQDKNTRAPISETLQIHWFHYSPYWRLDMRWCVQRIHHYPHPIPSDPPSFSFGEENILFLCVLHLTSLFSKVQGLLRRVGPLQRRVVVLGHLAGKRDCSPSRNRLICGHWLQWVLIWMERGTDARRTMRHCLHVMETT